MAVPTPSFSKEIDIVAGHQGRAHITAAQDARRIAGIVGKGMYFLNSENEFNLKIDNNTQVTISAGDLIVNGRHVSLEAPVALTIKPCSQGMKRFAAICVRVEIADGVSAVDRAKLVVIDGDETSGNAEHPSLYIRGSLLTGYTRVDVPLWYVPVDGITLGEPRRYIECKKLTTLSELKNEMKTEMQAKMKADIDSAKDDIRRIKASIANLSAKFPKET